ncbi:MBL fold metallo-hydrolase [Flagellimonas flava]|uniref:Glyoxylase, beta-lactamase superfamily II n=1 Tax=Flagellimonas flava TaxID=570519 RepID=A0A1M5NPG9_9FLAO|nr:MBL fold metallo-hydrolase [Allomuricauda flava]SHG90833.1 Glyoxylase, beta-lactamase superfamily II [Allomuricauda flava]
MMLTYVGLLTWLVSCKMTNERVHTKLQPNIYQINNQYFYGEKVHTYLIELKDQVLLFDIPTYSEDVKRFITSFDKPVIAILSHGSCGIVDGTKWQKEIGLTVHAHIDDTDHPWLRMAPDVFFAQMPNFGGNFEVIHTPGHSAGAICLLEKESKSLFTGDTFYGNKNGEIRDFTRERSEDYENPADRIESCKKLLNYDFENVYPFHYTSIIGEGKQRLEKYLENL